MRYRGLAWGNEETEIMLKFMKKNNLIATYSTLHLGQVLEKPLRVMGFVRTAIQIKFKLESLKASYIVCKKNGGTPKARENCPFYDLLDEIFKNIAIGNIDLNAKPVNVGHDKVEFLKSWSENEMKKMLSIINIMNLSKDLCLANFPALCLKLLSKGLMMAGFKKDIYQIQDVLFNLRTEYIKSRAARDNGLPGEMCPYYDSLDSIWGNKIISDGVEAGKSSEILSDKRLSHFITKRTLQDKVQWKETEILAMLDIIDELNLTSQFRLRFSTTLINKIVKPMNERGYNKSAAQIITKLKHLRSMYLKCAPVGHTPEAIKDCPHFERLQRMFLMSHKASKVNKPQLLDHNYGSEKLTDHSYIDTSEYPCQSPQQSIIFPTDTSDNKTQIYQNYITENVVERMEVVTNDKPANKTQSKSILNILSTSYNNISPKKEFEDDQVTSLARNDNLLSTQKIPVAQPEIKFPKFVTVVKQTPDNKLILTKHSFTPKTEQNQAESPSSSILKPSMTAIPVDKKSTVSGDSKNLQNIQRNICTKPLQATITASSANNSTFLPSLRGCGESAMSESIQLLLQEFLRQQEQLQLKKFAWMERQYEIQRQHDREQREILLNEIRDFRRIFEDAVSRNKY